MCKNIFFLPFSLLLPSFLPFLPPSFPVATETELPSGAINAQNYWYQAEATAKTHELTAGADVGGRDPGTGALSAAS